MTDFTIEKLTGTCLPLFINNRFVASSGPRIASFDPATGQEWASLSDSTADEVDSAVSAANDAMRNPAWRDMSQSNRGLLLGRLADLVARDAGGCGGHAVFRGHGRQDRRHDDPGQQT